MAKRARRLSDQAAAVLLLFLQDPERERYGLEIIREANLKSGLLYPILHRFEERGFLTSAWEPQEVAVAAGRRPRRLYRLDTKQLSATEATLEEWRQAVKEDRGASGSMREAFA
ncbi:MAG TPA: helix-turn-helix transcriptional regulator [Solirubrobacterales bacterium]|jgi:DNA-binding PadR family transcriptional regulator|nr:helix-turn-helix transcriptional regulator [Solirubrobacterales bacterium]